MAPQQLLLGVEYASQLTGPHAVSFGNELRTAMMLKLGGTLGLADIGQVQVGGDGGALLGCFDCRRPQVVSLLGAIPPEVRT